MNDAPIIRPVRKHVMRKPMMDAPIVRPVCKPEMNAPIVRPVRKARPAIKRVG